MKPVNNFLDSVLPTFGNLKENIPVYNEAQRMFISSNYTSAAGHLYYKGIRFSERLVMIEQVGLYHNWTYIDGIELYAFNGTERVLIAKKQFDKVFYNMEFIKEEVNQMLHSYFKSQILLKNENASPEIIEQHTNETIGSLYENKIEQIVQYLKQPTMIALLAPQN
jgi:hypothetical protein